MCLGRELRKHYLEERTVWQKSRGKGNPNHEDSLSRKIANLNFCKRCIHFSKAQLRIHNYFSPSRRPTYQRGGGQWTSGKALSRHAAYSYHPSIQEAGAEKRRVPAIERGHTEGRGVTICISARGTYTFNKHPPAQLNWRDTRGPLG